MFDVGGEFVDIVKFGWGTSYVTNNLEKKIALYRSFETPVVCGGTLFEVVYARGPHRRVQVVAAASIGFSHVEISDGTIDIPRERKLELIADFARDFTVLSEVGSKDPDVVYAPYQWVEWIKEEKDAGAWKVITEAREGGTAGIFRKDGDMRTGLIDEIAHEIALSDLIFEAPTKASQAWFVKHFGPNVNLGNIPPEEVIPLETLRLGLRGDTLKEVLLGERACSCRADVEAMTRRGDRSRFAARAVPRPRRARLLVPEGGDGPARHAVRARAEGARLRDRHAPSLPRDVRVLARGRAALRHDDRGLRRAVAGDSRSARRELWETKPDLYLAIAQGRAARRARSATSTPGSPASAATSRRRAPTRRSSAGTSSTSSGRRTRSPTGATTTCWAYIRERGLPYNPLHDRGYDSIGDTHSTQPGAGRAGRWAGTDKIECGIHTVPSAERREEQ